MTLARAPHECRLQVWQPRPCGHPGPSWSWGANGRRPKQVLRWRRVEPALGGCPRRGRRSTAALLQPAPEHAVTHTQTHGRTHFTHARRCTVFAAPRPKSRRSVVAEQPVDGGGHHCLPCPGRQGGAAGSFCKALVHVCRRSAVCAAPPMLAPSRGLAPVPPWADVVTLLAGRKAIACGSTGVAPGGIRLAPLRPAG